MTEGAIGGIIAKILVIVESVLDQYVTLDTFNVSTDCNITAYNATITNCGEELADQVSNLLYFVMALLNDVMAALAAEINTTAP